MQKAEKALQGLRVLVTRPQEQNSTMLTLLRNAGALPQAFPVTTIRDRSDIVAKTCKADDILASKLLIFISQNAVVYANRLFAKIGINRHALPAVAAIGKSTAEQLSHYDIPVSACPENPGSEALLRLASVTRTASSGRVTIFRGLGGKELLAQKLREISAHVVYLEVYERALPTCQALQLIPGKPLYDLAMVTSINALQNLYTLTAKASRSQLLTSKLLLGSKNQVATYQAMKFQKPPLVARSPLDRDMLQAAQDWWQNKYREP